MTGDPSRGKRQQAVKRGKLAEVAAATLLRLKGYGILETGVVTGRGSGAGEVDIVARKGNLLVFVEVKARPSESEAGEAISARQRQRIMRAAEAFLARRPEFASFDMRFDAVLVTPGRLPIHVTDAWRMDA